MDTVVRQLIGRNVSADVYIVPLGILGGLYTASIAFFQRVFIALTGNTSDASIVITALVLAGVFTPIRKTLEGVVDRRFKPRTSSDHSGRPQRFDGNPSSPDEGELAAVRQRLDGLERRLAALEEAGRSKAEASSERSDVV